MTQKMPEFNAANLEAWTLAAQKSAPGGDLTALNWITPDGISVKPLYTAEDTAMEDLPQTVDATDDVHQPTPDTAAPVETTATEDQTPDTFNYFEWQFPELIHSLMETEHEPAHIDLLEATNDTFISHARDSRPRQRVPLGNLPPAP